MILLGRVLVIDVKTDVMGGVRGILPLVVAELPLQEEVGLVPVIVTVVSGVIGLVIAI
jgi:hypothetical protein